MNVDFFFFFYTIVCVCVCLQVLPDYLKGLLIVLSPDKVSEPQFHQIAKLAALQHRAKDVVGAPTMYARKPATLLRRLFIHNATRSCKNVQRWWLQIVH